MRQLFWSGANIYHFPFIKKKKIKYTFPTVQNATSLMCWNLSLPSFSPLEKKRKEKKGKRESRILFWWRQSGLRVHKLPAPFFMASPPFQYFGRLAYIKVPPLAIVVFSPEGPHAHLRPECPNKRFLICSGALLPLQFRALREAAGVERGGDHWRGAEGSTRGHRGAVIGLNASGMTQLSSIPSSMFCFPTFVWVFAYLLALSINFNSLVHASIRTSIFHSACHLYFFKERVDGFFFPHFCSRRE